MPSFNRIILAGNLTRDPDLSYTPGNVAYCRFGLAVNRKWMTAEGESREDVLFIDCIAWKKGAETFKQYMAKGQPILVEGRLKFEKWQDQDGNKRSKHTVHVDNFQFLGGKPQDGEPAVDPAF